MIPKTYLLLCAGLVLAGVFGYRIYQIRYAAEQAPAGDRGLQQATPQSKNGDKEGKTGIRVGGTGKYTVEALPIPQQSAGTAPAPPSLDRSLVFPPVFSGEAQRLMTDKMKAAVADIKKNPQSFNAWANLGVLRHDIDDFEGAKEIWQYLARVSPDQPVPYVNLANLYAFELKDPVKAEENFTKALEKGPKEVLTWRSAYEFYRYVRKDDGKAREILKRGIAETNSPDLQYLSDHYTEL